MKNTKGYPTIYHELAIRQGAVTVPRDMREIVDEYLVQTGKCRWQDYSTGRLHPVGVADGER